LLGVELERTSDTRDPRIGGGAGWGHGSVSGRRVRVLSSMLAG
jgi:hypothetical protein